MDIVSIKCSFSLGGETESRRFTCQGYDSFLNLITRYTKKEIRDLKFMYLDTDDDWVTFSSEEEWNCIEGAEGRFLKIRVSETVKVKQQKNWIREEKCDTNPLCEVACGLEKLKTTVRTKGKDFFKKLKDPKSRLKVRLWLIIFFFYLILGWKFIFGAVFGKFLYKKIRKKLEDIDPVVEGERNELGEEEEEEIAKKVK